MSENGETARESGREFDYRYWARKAADWGADYRKTLGERPVRAQVPVGFLREKVPQSPPRRGESMEKIFADFDRIIPEGMTHWQHPRFFAYFPCNAAPEAQIADQLASSMAAQCMLWQTSPAATELEIRMVDWLRQAVGLPDVFRGTFQDTASSATLCAVLMMREKALEFRGNKEGLFGKTPLRIYASAQNHTSIDKALWIAGLGGENLVKIPAAGERFAMDENALKEAIRQDREKGLMPAGIIVCAGGTSIGAVDRVRQVCEIAKEEGLMTHLDAAWAGSAMVCPEFRSLWEGAELADSIVLNPHKWLGAPLECSLHLVREPEILLRTLAIRPDYLKTLSASNSASDDDSLRDQVNFSEWGVQLGRRFRALKVWFLMRAYGLEGLQSRIRDHVKWSQELARRLEAEEDFEIVTQPVLALFSFRHIPPDKSEKEYDDHNLALVNAINEDGRIYLTQSNHEGSVIVRFVSGSFDMRAQDADIAFETITELARR